MRTTKTSKSGRDRDSMAGLPGIGVPIDPRLTSVVKKPEAEGEPEKSAPATRKPVHSESGEE